MAETIEPERTAVMDGELMDEDHGLDQVPVVIDGALIGGLTRAEIDVQIATAHRFRRVTTAVKRMIETLATLDQETAEGCFYRLPRKEWDPRTKQMVDKIIEGPSARFAEIVLASYGNARVASRRTDLTETDVEATGIFHDLEANVAWAKSVRRSITTSPKKGDPKRFSADMINVTTNAAASIALRNAILAGVPRGYWWTAYTKAVQAAKGTADTLLARRAKMIKAFAELETPVGQAQLFEILGVRGLDDITLDLMFDATGLLNALRDGDVTLEELLAERKQGATAPTLDDALKPGAPRQARSKEAAKEKPPEGESRGAAAAQSAEPDKDTKASATAASDASPGPTDSGQPESSPRSDDGAAADTQYSAAVVGFPGDRKIVDLGVGLDPKDGVIRGVVEQREPDVSRETADTAEDSEQERQGEGGQADAEITVGLSAEEIEHFNRYAAAVKGADAWAKIKPSVEWLLRQPFLAKAPADTAQGALLLAYQTAEALNEQLFADQKVKPENDATFFRLYLRTKPPKAELMNAFRVLMRAPDFTGRKQEDQDVILDELEEAKK
jgi:hypothetical protein